MALDYLPNNRFRDILQCSIDENLSDCYARYYMRLFPNIKTVLDLGTGRGNFVKSARRFGLNVFGVDRRNIFEYDLSRLVIADIEALPFRDDSFCLVFEFYTLLDMMQLQQRSTDEAVSEVGRVLRVGGFLVTNPAIVIGNFSSDKHYFKSVPNCNWGGVMGLHYKVR